MANHLNSTCHSFYSTPDEYRDIFSFERTFNYFAVHWWMVTLHPYIVALTLFYVVAIHAGQHYMKHRPAFKLRTALLLWNLSLSFYSLLAFIRMFGETAALFQKYGFEYSICELHSVEHRNLMGFWIFTLAVSKVMELGDTVFIVLRKQPLIFLHWYHHVATLLFVWYCCVYISSLGRWFILANLFVHAIMYFYYALKVLRVKVPRKVSMTITATQLLQMVVGITITVKAYWIKHEKRACCVEYELIFYSWAMYLSYFVLFLNFFVKAYLHKTPQTTKTFVIDAGGKKAD